MRRIAVLSGALLAAAFCDAAKADPYRWCAEYGGGRGGATNSYFITLQQCQAAASGNGGFCRQNPFCTGPDRQRAHGVYGIERRW